MSRRLTVLLVGAALTTLVLVMSSTAWATTFAVSSTSDSGEGSLREAITAANANPGAEAIAFAEGVSRQCHRSGGELHDEIFMQCLSDEFERPVTPGKDWGFSAWLSPEGTTRIEVGSG